MSWRSEDVTLMTMTTMFAFDLPLLDGTTKTKTFLHFDALAIACSLVYEVQYDGLNGTVAVVELAFATHLVLSLADETMTFPYVFVALLFAAHLVLSVADGTMMTFPYVFVALEFATHLA